MADLVNTPQFKFPLQVVNGSVAVVEQDSEEDHFQNAIVAMLYLRGQRTELPEFGVPEQAFKRNGADRNEIIAAVRQWEPEVQVEVIDSIIKEGVNTVTVELTADTTDGTIDG